jgi:Acyl-protein synthetase, LuxE
MSALLELAPYGPRRDAEFIDEMNDLTRFHMRASPKLARIWRDWQPANSTPELPFLHVGIFKSLDFTQEGVAVSFGRTLESSSTTGSQPSRIPLDAESSRLQSLSVSSILRSFIGPGKRPLLIVDAAQSLRTRGTIPARAAAALSLRPLASDLFFLLPASMDSSEISVSAFERALDSCRGDSRELLVYGFTWALWQAWQSVQRLPNLSARLAETRITFLHSGGWKKLENCKVTRQEFDSRLASSAAPGSRVVDFYGLVEQVGIVYPLCEYGSRHVPVWADVLVRDSRTLETLTNQPGQLALMNCLAKGAPYQSILTEDIGRIIPKQCPCGRSGRRFELLGRLPKAEVRGCANV